MELGTARWPEVPTGARVLVPIGSTEQHGPHLPLSTDTVIADAVAHAVAAQLSDRTGVTPPIAFGASGEHAGFPGTISIGAEAVRWVIVETVRSLALWAGPIVFVNGHGGNVAVLDQATVQLREEGHDVRWVPCGMPGGDAHAGRTETSLMLHLAPETVALDLAEPGATAPIAELLPRLRVLGVKAVSPNGVLGDPTGASAAEGAEFFAEMVEATVRRIRGFASAGGAS